MENPRQELPLRSIAQTLGTTELNVLMHIKRGLLDGSETDAGWMVSLASFERYLAEYGEHKSTSLCKSHCAKASSCSGCG